MKAIFKPFFALCGMIALSTALSADSRVSPVGGAASSGAAGFLYSDYLQTASDEGHELGFQGSFVVAERRSFLSGLADSWRRVFRAGAGRSSIFAAAGVGFACFGRRDF